MNITKMNKVKRFFGQLFGIDYKKIGVLKNGEYLTHLKKQSKNTVCRLLVKRTIQYEQLKNELIRLGMYKRIDKKFTL